MNIDWSLVAAVAFLVGGFIADTAVTKRGGRYAVAVHRLVVLIVGIVVPAIYLALSVIDGKAALSWWNGDQSWGTAIVAAVVFPLMLIYGGYRLPTRAGQYRRERDVRSGKLVRTVETRGGVTYETVELAADADRRNRFRDSLNQHKH